MNSANSNFRLYSIITYYLVYSYTVVIILWSKCILKYDVKEYVGKYNYPEGRIIHFVITYGNRRPLLSYNFASKYIT